MLLSSNCIYGTCMPCFKVRIMKAERWKGERHVGGWNNWRWLQLPPENRNIKFQFITNFEWVHTKRIAPVLNDPSDSISIPCKIKTDILKFWASNKQGGKLRSSSKGKPECRKQVPKHCLLANASSWHTIRKRKIQGQKRQLETW
jgi:hypothetical protein